MSEEQGQALHGRAAIRLIAQREVITRTRTRAYRITMLVSVAVVVVGIVAPKALNTKAGSYRVDIVGNVAPAATGALRISGAAVGRKVTFRHVEDAAAGTRDVRNGSANLAFDGETLVVDRVPTQSATGTFARFLAIASGSLRIHAGLVDAGLSNDQVEAVFAHAPLPVRGLGPPREDRIAQKGVTMVGIIFIFAFLQQYGAWVLNGIVEEKSSRVIELLLSVVRPREMLIGKTVGIGLVALFHGAIVAIAALLASAATGSNVLRGGGVAIVAQMLVWFVLAYSLFCLLMAMAGSMVARQEEAQGASFPFMFMMLVGYVTSVSTIFSDSVPPIVKVLSFVPLSAAFAMPARMAAGPVPAVHVAISMATMLLSVVVVAGVATRVYERGVLHTKRAKLLDLVRAQPR